MRGYPKHINTRADLDEAMLINESRTRAWLRQSLDNRNGWRLVARLDNPADGVEDETHRITSVDSEDGGETEYYQEDWGPLSGNVIDRLGLSVAEAEDMATQDGA